jgi:hypothetical protein
MKVWITKYALTAGIIETGTAEKKSLLPGTITANIGMPSNYFHRTEWQSTRELAVARANIMRDHRIQALKKQIAKLEAMEFK